VCVFVAEVGPASVMVGNLVAGKRMAQASGRDLSHMEDNEQVNAEFVYLQRLRSLRVEQLNRIQSKLL